MGAWSPTPPSMAITAATIEPSMMDGITRNGSAAAKRNSTLGDAHHANAQGGEAGFPLLFAPAFPAEVWRVLPSGACKSPLHMRP